MSRLSSSGEAAYRDTTGSATVTTMPFSRALNAGLRAALAAT